MRKSNIADFQAAANSRNRKEVVDVADICGNEIGHYKANVKSELMMFVYGQVRGMKQKDAAIALGITQAQVSLLKNLRVSQFSIDRLFEMAYMVGYTFDMEPYSYREAYENNNVVSHIDYQKEREVE